MSVKELKQVLEGLDENTQVVIRPQNSNYVECVYSNSATKRHVQSFFGNDYDAYVITTHQIGNI